MTDAIVYVNASNDRRVNSWEHTTPCGREMHKALASVGFDSYEAICERDVPRETRDRFHAEWTRLMQGRARVNPLLSSTVKGPAATIRAQVESLLDGAPRTPAQLAEAIGTVTPENVAVIARRLCYDGIAVQVRVEHPHKGERTHRHTLLAYARRGMLTAEFEEAA